MKDTMVQETLAGWGNYPRLVCDRRRAHSTNQAVALVAGSPRVTPRGLGRSYGDPAISTEGIVLDCVGLDRYLSFDAQSGTLTCEAGTSLEAILRDFGPRGFLPMVTPGTKFVTVGGCIANDVHGKAHHVDGCFSECTDSFRILLADGSIRNASRDENADLFWANFGGMGLLGVILDATIRLRRVETMYFRQSAVSVGNLDEMMDALDANHHLPYSVAWVDSLATGKNLGRGVLTTGEHATRSDLSGARAREPLTISDPSPISLPFEMPSAALNSATIRILNAVLDQVQKRGAAIAHYEKFFYPLDFVGDWNRGYGPKGFTQYQFVVPMEGGRENVRELLELISGSGQSPFLNVLKRFGPERAETSLSFPFTGYTFAIDFPVRSGLTELLTKLDARVVAMGGRVYLGKDAFLTKDAFEKMYPRLDAWRAVKAKYDPERRFHSSLAERIGL